MKAGSNSHAVCDSITSGVNSISSISESESMLYSLSSKSSLLSDPNYLSSAVNFGTVEVGSVLAAEVVEAKVCVIVVAGRVSISALLHSIGGMFTRQSREVTERYCI